MGLNNSFNTKKGWEDILIILFSNTNVKDCILIYNKEIIITDIYQT